MKTLLSEPEIVQIETILSSIATQAGVLVSVLLDHSESAESESYHAAHSIAREIGYLADHGVMKIEGVPMRGGAEQWFLPPVYHRAREENEQATVGAGEVRE